MRIRTKLVLAISFVVLFTMLGATSFLYFFESNFLSRQADLSRRRALEGLAHVCQESIVQKNDLMLLDYVKTIVKEPAVVNVVLRDVHGNVLMHSDFLKGDFSAAGKEAGPAPRDPRRFSMERPVLVGGSPAGAVRVVYDQSIAERTTKEALQGTVMRFLQVAAIALMLGVLLAIVISGRLVRPLYALALGARNIGNGDLDYRISLDTEDELGQLASAFNEMGAKLKALDEAKDEFLARASHDLRNPVASLVGFAELLRESELTDSQAAYVRYMSDAAAFLKTLCTNLLDLAQIKTGRMEFKKVPVSARELCRSVVEIFAGQAAANGIRLGADVPECRLLLADSQAIRRVLANLVSNALKFTPKGGKVSIICKVDGESLRTSVVDTGIGIPANKLQSVFGKFSQVQETAGKVRDAEGTGLGLCISKEIIEAHGGRIWVESDLGKGAAFHYTLPLG